MALFDHYVAKVIRWPESRRLDEAFEITLHLGWVEGRMECVGVDVRSFRLLPGEAIPDMERVAPTGPQAVTTSLLRGIPLARLVDEARVEALRRIEAQEDALSKPTRLTRKQVREELTARGFVVYPVRGRERRKRVERQVRREQETWTPPRGRGRPPKYGPDHFQEVARVYREAYAINRTPTRAVARHFEVSQAAAAKWVARARDGGFLPLTTRGKARVVEPPKGRGRKR